RPGATFYATADLRADALALLARIRGGDADGPHRPGRLAGLAAGSFGAMTAGSAYRAGYDGDAARYTRARFANLDAAYALGALDAAAARARDVKFSTGQATKSSYDLIIVNYNRNYQSDFDFDFVAE
ncbi:unnamed protein product, partial [Rotaria sordida]